MALFVCDRCLLVDNTARDNTYYTWARGDAARALCSACCRGVAATTTTPEESLSLVSEHPDWFHMTVGMADLVDDDQILDSVKMAFGHIRLVRELAAKLAIHREPTPEL